MPSTPSGILSPSTQAAPADRAAGIYLFPSLSKPFIATKRHPGSIFLESQLTPVISVSILIPQDTTSIFLRTSPSFIFRTIPCSLIHTYFTFVNKGNRYYRTVFHLAAGGIRLRGNNYRRACRQRTAYLKVKPCVCQTAPCLAQR